MLGRSLAVILTILMVVVGATLMAGGIALAAAGGSFYYLAAGAATLAAAWGLARARAYALPVFGALLAATLAWALWESGFDGWALAPRLIAPALLGLCLLAPPVRRRCGAASPWWIVAPVLAIAVAFGVSILRPKMDDHGLKTAAALRMADPAQGEWRQWGRTLGGDRFSPLSQIDTGNVA